MISTPVFTFNLNQKILPGLVTLGRYSDGTPSLTAVTTSNKIIIHSLQTSEEGANRDGNDRSLNMTQPITCVAAARFKNDDADVLLVCTKSSILVYNVDQNQDVFTRDVTDGGNVVVHGLVAKEELVLVGGNCSVQGFDKVGLDPYWIVTGDNVRSLALVDIDGDGENELVVGSDDYDIRIFKDDDLVHEITETQIVTHLYSLGDTLFAYTLANGTVGVYEKLHRLWRVKSKNRATYLLGYDINGDGVLELITGWQGGKVDGRNVRTGEVLFKDNFSQTIAGLCEGDCRNVGKNDLIVVSITGEVRGYNPYAPKSLKTKTNELNYEQETIRELFGRKHALLLELKNYEANSRLTGTEPDENLVGAIPARTRLQTSIGINLGSTSQMPHVEIMLSTNNETIIRAVIAFAEGIFKGETHVKHPKLYDVESKLSISLYPPRDVPIDIHIKALVGYPDSKQFHVFEVTRQLPRFSMYTLVDNPPSKTVSNVVFFVNERTQRIMLWINRNFLLPNAIDINSNADLKLFMISLRDGKELAIYMDPAGKMTIETDNVTLAGDLIQSLASYLNLDHLKSTADFPLEERKCIDLLEKLQELETVKRKLNMDLGDKSSLIRNLIIRSEDARLLNDLKLMKRFYNELNELNNDVRNGYEIRVTNYNDIVSAIKELNGIIQKASRLRYGKYKTDPVALSKNAISMNNPNLLIKAIRTGEA